MISMREKLELQYVLPGLVIIYLSVLSNAQNGCNRTCGTTTVRYPFGFSGECPYRLDKDCSSDGQVYLKGYKVVDLTNETVIIDPWSKLIENTSSNQCYQEINILSVFRQQFALTNRNVFLLGPDCKQPDCNFTINNVLEMGNRRKSCSNVNLRNFTCVTNTESKWLRWKILDESTCKDMLSSTIYEGQMNGSISFKVNNLELAWWLNGTCRCSKTATCCKFLDPNNNRTAHRCSCPAGFLGDGYLEGSGCTKVDVNSRCSASGYLSGSCGKNSKLVVVISSIFAAAILVSVIVLLYYNRGAFTVRKRRLRAERILSAHGSLTVPIYSYRELEKATKGFSDKERLGSGAFGTVYAGKLPSKRFVAVKKMRHVDSDGNGMERVLNEINLISSLDHPNLLRLLGCCLEEGREPILVFEFMPNGTLCQHLQRERGEGLSWRRRVKIAADTAGALAYLHSAINPPIYHRDIKSSNILLDYDFSCKVSDFGLSRLVMSESSHISTRPQGTPGYLDPQYHQNFQLSDKSDVYSFGVVLAEMITGLKVVDFSRRKNEINLAWLAADRIRSNSVDEIVDPFLKVDNDLSVRRSLHRVAELAFRCLAFDKDARPLMTEVAHELSYLADEDDDEEEDDTLKREAVQTSATTSDQDQWFSSKSSVSSNFNL